MQAVRIELALANGTLLVLTPDSNPHLWKAGQVWHFDNPCIIGQIASFPLMPALHLSQSAHICMPTCLLSGFLFTPF